MTLFLHDTLTILCSVRLEAVKVSGLQVGELQRVASVCPVLLAVTHQLIMSAAALCPLIVF